VPHLPLLLHQRDCASPCLSMSSPPLSPSAFSKQAFAAGSRLKPFSKKPFGFHESPKHSHPLLSTLEAFHLNPSHPAASRCPSLYWLLPRVAGRDASSPLSSLQERSASLGHSISHQRLTPWGGEYHWARKTAEVRRK